MVHQAYTSTPADGGGIYLFLLHCVQQEQHACFAAAEDIDGLIAEFRREAGPLIQYKSTGSDILAFPQASDGGLLHRYGFLRLYDSAQLAAVVLRGRSCQQLNGIGAPFGISFTVIQRPCCQADARLE